MRERQYRLPIVLPVILISVGVLALIQNLDRLPLNVWQTVWQLWPVVLILLGVEIILNQLRLPQALGFVLALAVIVASVGGITYYVMQGTGESGIGMGEAQHIEHSLSGVTSASVTVMFGAGTLQLGSLSGDQLMVGDFRAAGRQSPVNIRFSASGGHGDLLLDVPQNQVIPIFSSGRGSEWQVKLNNSIPLDVRVQAGASTNDLDLTDLRLTDLNVQAGVSTTTIRLPKTGKYPAHISGGLATTTVYIPDGVSARIRVESGLASINVDQSRFPRSGDYYVSPDYGTAANSVDLFIEGGLATISIR